MFGCVGVYVGDVFFAIVDGEQLYFKVDQPLSMPDHTKLDRRAEPFASNYVVLDAGRMHDVDAGNGLPVYG